MRIKSIEAENFKLFTSKFTDISELSQEDLIIFNGPNGYGKTSIFDIIEFSLTGEIKRILKYCEELKINKNEAYDSKILISDEEKESYVKICFEDNGQIVEFIRKYTPTNSRKKKVSGSKENNPYNIFECFSLEIVCDGQVVQDPELFLKNNRFTDIKEIYDKCCFLSQDEHLQFLKATKESKADGLEFLFDIPGEWNKKIDKITKQTDLLSNQKKQISILKQLKYKEHDAQAKVDSLKNKIKVNVDNSSKKYMRLFESRNIAWDNETVDFSELNYEEVKEELDNLSYFSLYKDEAVNYCFNYPYKILLKPYSGDSEISFNEYPLEYAYRYFMMLKKADLIEARYEKEKKYRSTLNTIQNANYENLNWQFMIEESFIKEEEVTVIKEQLESIKQLKRTQTILQKAIASFTQSRETLISNTNIMMDNGAIDNAICPICGATYENREKLESEIVKETHKLKDIVDESTKNIADINKRIYDTYLKNVESKISPKLGNAISEDYYNRLQSIKEYSGKIFEIEKQLAELNISLENEHEVIQEVDYNDLFNRINGKLLEVPDNIRLQLENRKFLQYYSKFYSSDEQTFRGIHDADLKAKNEYLEYLYYDSNHKELTKVKKELTKIQKRINKVVEINSELEDYRRAIQEGISDYKMNIIRDIEPLLYVYTAKILQQKFNGKSIYIYTSDDMKKIQFVNSPKDNQDILYSMSSGQLSAVAIAFLLCMNQVYGKMNACSTILIDDPVQTIDDVNMVGLVDILRYGFKDRQIFISTHEQSFEWFLRYRYAKADKNVKVFNMKEIILKQGIIA